MGGICSSFPSEKYFEIKGRITRIMPMTTKAIPTNVKKSNRRDMLFKRW
jgi:hypothetical protein